MYRPSCVLRPQSSSIGTGLGQRRERAAKSRRRALGYRLGAFAWSSPSVAEAFGHGTAGTPRRFHRNSGGLRRRAIGTALAGLNEPGPRSLSLPGRLGNVRQHSYIRHSREGRNPCKPDRCSDDQQPKAPLYRDLPSVEPPTRRRLAWTPALAGVTNFDAVVD